MKKATIKKLTPLLQGLSYRLLFHYKQAWLFDGLVRANNLLRGSLLRVEASSVCQLSCPACSMARWRKRGAAQTDHEGGAIGWGVLKHADFQRLLTENPQIRVVELSNWGEIFLNPELLAIMRTAHERGVTLRAVNGVNLNHASEEMLEAMVRYRFGQLTISIDGACHETYKQYRRRGSFNRVLRNIRTINRHKTLHGSRWPKLTWQFIVFGHNEHELPLARRLASELGMSFRPKLNHTPGFSPVRDRKAVEAEIGIPATRIDYLHSMRRAYSRPCTQLWTSPQINWDGKLLGCCANKLGDFGNVFQTGLSATLAGERFRYAKRMVLGLAPPRADIPCTRCKVYRRHVLDDSETKPV